MDLKKVIFGIGLILMSLFSFVYADENTTVNDTIVDNNTIVNDTILENATINDSIIENITINETVSENTTNDTDENETSTAILVFEDSYTEKYLDYVNENLEDYKLWIIFGLIVFAGYFVMRIL